MNTIHAQTDSVRTTLKTNADLIGFSKNKSAEVPSATNKDKMVKHNQLLATQTVRLKKEEINVRYAALGDPSNPPVLLLHGVPENLQAWYAVAPMLAKKYYVLALDWPGFGGSDPLKLPEDYTSRCFSATPDPGTSLCTTATLWSAVPGCVVQALPIANQDNSASEVKHVDA